jgi:hypothetical protein
LLKFSSRILHCWSSVAAGDPVDAVGVPMLGAWLAEAELAGAEHGSKEPISRRGAELAGAELLEAMR